VPGWTKITGRRCENVPGATTKRPGGTVNDGGETPWKAARSVTSMRRPPGNCKQDMLSIERIRRAATKHGWYSKATKAQRRRIRELVRACNAARADLCF